MKKYSNLHCYSEGKIWKIIGRSSNGYLVGDINGVRQYFFKREVIMVKSNKFVRLLHG